MAQLKKPEKMSREELTEELERAHTAAKKARSRYNLIRRLIRKNNASKK